MPTIALQGAADAVGPPESRKATRHFTGPYERRLIPEAGHNVPQEAPAAMAEAVLALVARGS